MKLKNVRNVQILVIYVSLIKIVSLLVLLILTEKVNYLVIARRNFIIIKIFVNNVKYNVLNVNILLAIVQNVTSFLETYINNKISREDANVRKDSILNNKKPVKNASIYAFKIVPNTIVIVSIIVSNVLKTTLSRSIKIN